MSFVAFDVPDKDERVRFESRMISTISICRDCLPSEGWMGHFSPKDRIRQTGLWLVNRPLTPDNIERLSAALH